MENSKIVPMNIREAKFKLSDYMVRRKIKETYYRNDGDELTIRSIIDKIWYFYPEADVKVINPNTIIVNREGEIRPEPEDYSYMLSEEAEDAREKDKYMYSELSKRKGKTIVEEGYELKWNSPISMDELMEAIWDMDPEDEIDVLDYRHLVVRYSLGEE